MIRNWICVQRLCGLLVVAVVTMSASQASAVLIDPGFTGVKTTDTWETGTIIGPSNPGYPTFPGTGAWPAAIASAEAGASSDATLNKTANGTGGGPYPASGSIYFGGFSSAVNNNGGQLTVTDANPVAGVVNVALQVVIAEAWTYDFWNSTLPVLNYNGGNQALAPTLDWLFDQQFNGTVSMPTGEEPIYINSYLAQWDLSSVAGPITSLSLSFNGVQHAQVYGLRLDQSDAFTVAEVPEPTSLALAGLAAAGLAVVVRRRKSA